MTPRSRPRICMLLQQRYASDARVKREARTLGEDYDVHLIALRERGDPTGVHRDGTTCVHHIDVWTRRLPRTPLFWFVKYLEYVVRIAVGAARVRPDAYHAHDLPMVVPAVLARWLHRAPIVYDAHELFGEMHHPHRFLGRAWRRVDRWALRRIDRLIAVNRSRAEVMVEELGAPEPWIIPNLPIHYPAERIPPREESPLRAWLARQHRRDDPILLYQGLIDPSRNLANVVRAMSLVRSPAVLVLMGHHNAYVDTLLALAETEGVSQRVLYYGAVDSDALPAYTAGADAGLVIYAREPLNNYLCAPNKLFEYCMAGVPVVGCDYPEVRRPLDEHPAGELFDPDHPDSIAAAIDRLLGDADRTASARAETLKLREEYHWGTAREVLLELYAGLLANPTSLRSASLRAPT